MLLLVLLIFFLDPTHFHYKHVSCIRHISRTFVVSPFTRNNTLRCLPFSCTSIYCHPHLYHDNYSVTIFLIFLFLCLVLSLTFTCAFPVHLGYPNIWPIVHIYSKFVLFLILNFMLSMFRFDLKLSMFGYPNIWSIVHIYSKFILFLILNFMLSLFLF